MKEDFEEYKKILDKYKYPYKDKEEILEIISNIENLAQVFLDFEKQKNHAENIKSN